MPRRSPKGEFRGTGFAIGNGKLIVTNAHVLPDKLDTANFEIIAVFFHQKKQIKMVKAKTVAIDKVHDIAILKLLTDSLPVLKLDSTKVREGQSITFTGFPIGMVLGLYPVTHRGIVSAISPVVIPMLRSKQLNTKLLKRLREPFNVYQLDATAYPGNSGSPVYDTETGDVIGIVNKVFVKESKENVLSKPSGITYAIPIRHLNELLKKYKLI
jgi:S1-C subfamily serine protease